MKTLTKKTGTKSLKKKWDKKEVIACYAMLAFPIIGFFVFTLYPMLWAGRISFFSYDGIDSHTKFVGWENYKALFVSAPYWRTWLVNIAILVIKMPIEALLAFIVAYILNEKTKFAGFYRTMYYLPAIISAAIVALMFSNIFDYFGVINANLVKFGIINKPINWFENTATSMAVVMLTTLWMSFGTNVLYFIAALSNVSKEVNESAMIDGANGATRMFKITLPMILPMMQVLMLLSINGILHLGEIVLLLTGGAPAGTTYTVQAYLMRYIVPGFGGTSDLGYMSAASIITSIICCVVAVTFNKISDRIKEKY